MQQFFRTYGYNAAIFVAVTFVVALAFGHSLSQGFAPIDDYHLIVQNLAVRQFSFSSIHWIFTHFDPELYIPVTFFSYQLEHLLAGIQPWMYHFDNLLLHSLNALLVYFLIRRTHESRIIAACCALLFAVHPVTTETVVWISGRKDLLATFFGLLSLLTTVRSIEKNSLWLYILSAVLFLLALLSKISIAPLALLLPFFLPSNIPLKERFKITAPFLIFSIFLIIVAIAGKETVVGSTSLIDRLFLSATAIVRILTHIFLPMNLSVYYALPSPIISTLSIASVLIVCCLSGAAWFFRDRQTTIALGLCWFLMFVILPVLNVSTDFHASGTTFASDRYAYLPLIGILFLIASMLSWMKDEFESAGIQIVTVTTIILCGIFILTSRNQTRVWDSAESLYLHAVKAEPASAQARVALATLQSNADNDAQAFEILKEGLKFSADPKLQLAAGNLYAKAGQVADAEEQFQKVRNQVPSAGEPLYGLGVLALYKGNTNEAETLFRQAIEKEPRYTRARMALSDVLLKKGDSKGAETELREALKFDEWNPELLLKASEILALNGHKDESEQFQKRASFLEGPLP